MPKRVLLGKPGLDGHDRGVKIIARACRDAGFEVVYTGMRCSAPQLAETAVQEDVDVIGLSILSGAHLALTRQVLEELQARDAADIPVLVGGTISQRDEQRLKDLGAVAVFGVTTPLERITSFISVLPGRAEAAAPRPRERRTP